MDKDQEQARILQEISMCRDDERNSHSLMIQVVSVAGTILGVLLASSFFKHDGNAKEENLWILSVLSDLVFLAAYCFIAHLGIENVLRYHYLQDLGKQLCEYGNPSNEFLDWMSAISPITTRNILHLKSFFSWTHYFTYMGTPALAFGLCILISFYLFWQSKENMIAKAGFGILIAATVFGLLLLIAFSVHSRKIYEWSKKRAQNNKKCSSKPKNQKEIRRGILYFIYPKIQDMQKLAMFILGAVFALYYQSTDLSSFINSAQGRLADFGIAFFAMEYCLYAARYQWNDIRGASEDEAANKMRKSNRGLPWMLDNKKKDVHLSSFILGIRLLLWIIALLYLINRRNTTYWSLFVVSGLIMVATVFYESARFDKNNNYNWILFLVGFGYPLRFWAGYLAVQPSLAVVLKDSSLWLVLTFTLFALYFYGIMVATLPWTFFAREEKEKGCPYSKHYYKDLEGHFDALRYRGFSVKKIMRAPWGLSGFISILMFPICLVIASILYGGITLKIKIFLVVSAVFVLGTFLFLYFVFDPDLAFSKCLKGVSVRLRELFSRLYELFVGKQTKEWMDR